MMDINTAIPTAEELLLELKEQVSDRCQRSIITGYTNEEIYQFALGMLHAWMSIMLITQEQEIEWRDNIWQYISGNTFPTIYLDDIADKTDKRKWVKYDELQTKTYPITEGIYTVLRHGENIYNLDNSISWTADGWRNENRHEVKVYYWLMDPAQEAKRKAVIDTKRLEAKREELKKRAAIEAERRKAALEEAAKKAAAKKETAKKTVKKGAKK